jgi:hypothetical protein
MASYFVAQHAAPLADVAVHDRSRCPPACFLRGAATEYLGEFLDASQAVAVARLRYAHARGCPACETQVAHPRPLASAAALPTAPA